MAAVNEKLLEEQLTALEAARTWSPRLVSKLESHIRSANDAELLRINPISLRRTRASPRRRRSISSCTPRHSVFSR